MGQKVSASAQIMCYKSYTDLNDPVVETLCKKALEATTSAYAPYSSYPVGVALKLQNGEIITGNNQENAVYPLGLCAERVTIYAATSQYPKYPIHSIAIATLKDLDDEEYPPFPCGSCRQVMIEMEQRFKTDITLYMVEKNGALCRVDGVRQLLPFAFDVDSL